MDRFRVRALEKLLHTPSEKYELVRQTLLKKYELLLKGVIKYDKITDITLYKEKIHFHLTKEYFGTTH
jgi:hypothetical protein